MRCKRCGYAVQLWIAFQLLHALAYIHEKGLVHGDLKCENVLVTSWSWVFMTDFASYKPTCLPADNPVRLCPHNPCPSMFPHKLTDCMGSHECHVPHPIGLRCLEKCPAQDYILKRR